MDSEIHQAISSWVSVISFVGPLLMTIAGWVFVLGRTSSKFESLEVAVTKQGEDHTKALEQVENRTSLRMTTMEARQAKLEDLLYTKLDSVDTKLHSISAAVAETKGYMRAQQEMK